MEQNKNNTSNWLSHNWTKVLIYLFGGLIILGIVRFVAQIFNGDGPIQTGIGKALGSFANIVNGIVNGCSSQADCSKPQSEDTCNKSEGCLWNKATSGDTKSSCLNITGNTPGNRGLFSTSCLLGMGLLAYIAATLILPIGKFLYNLFSKPNENIKTASTLSNTSIEDVIKKAVDESRKDAGKAKEKIEEKSGEPMSPKAEENLGQLAGIQQAETAVDDAASVGGLSPQEEAKVKTEATNYRAQQEVEAAKEAEKNNVSEREQQENKDALEPEPRELTKYVNNRLHMYLVNDNYMSPTVFKFLKSKVKNKDDIHPHLQQGFNYYSMKYTNL